MSRSKRRRGVPLYVWVSDEEYAAIGERMAQAGTQNLSAYIRKMALVCDNLKLTHLGPQ